MTQKAVTEDQHLKEDLLEVRGRLDNYYFLSV